MISPIKIRTLTKDVIGLYRKIAYDDSFAKKWSNAVEKGDIEKLEHLYAEVTPYSRRKNTALSTNGIGFFVIHEFPEPVYGYSNGIYILPGQVQFHFNTEIIQAIAREVLPFYLRIIHDREYANSIKNAIYYKDRTGLSELIGIEVASPYFISTSVERDGFTLSFQFPLEPYVYHVGFFREYQQ